MAGLEISEDLDLSNLDQKGDNFNFNLNLIHLFHILFVSRKNIAVGKSFFQNFVLGKWSRFWIKSSHLSA